MNPVEVSTWSELGQCCWIRMLALKRAWQIDLPCQEAMPDSELEKSIDSSVSSLLHDPDNYTDIPSDDRPWVLARFLFGAGLLQPRNLHLLELPDPADPAEALQFLLREEWHQAGRELWPPAVLGENLLNELSENERQLACGSRSIFSYWTADNGHRLHPRVDRLEMPSEKNC